MNDSRMWLIGEGELYHSFLELALEMELPVSLPTPEEYVPTTRSPGIVVSLRDGWDKEEMRRQENCRTQKLHFLHGRFDGDTGIIGPLVNPLRPGCVMCAEQRRELIQSSSQPDFAHTYASTTIGGAYGLTPLSHTLVQATMKLIEQEYLQASRSLSNAIFIVDKLTLEGRWHHCIPVSTCGYCGCIPEDSAQLARIELEYKPRQSPSVFRVQSPSVHLRSLKETFVDKLHGPVFRTSRDIEVPPALYAAEFPVPGEEPTGVALGLEKRWESGEFVAILEAVERLAGMSPSGKRTAVRASYNELGTDAINPESLGLHDPAFYDHPDFELVPYCPDLQVNWVWGYSLRQQKPLLVPEQIAYYGLRESDGSALRERFCQETSNGCSIGGSLEEAIFHALLEVIERDAFLMTWYARLGVRELIPNNKQDLLTKALITELAIKGYSVHFFDITNDFGVPAVWALVVGLDETRPKSFTGAAAHPYLDKALGTALSEVAVPALRVADVRMDERTSELQRLREMLRTPHKVRTLEDHIDLYTLPEAFERFSFLLDDEREQIPLEEATSEIDDCWRSHDLTECLNHLTYLVFNLGLDVVVVDQTPPEQVAMGLHTVKTIVPGTLPMTFGHVYHRTKDIPRLMSVPVNLGHHTRTLDYDDLQILPHPFP